MNKTLFLIAMITLLIFTTGCEIEENPTKINQVNSFLREVILEDGTRCIIYHASYAGGLSCDFKELEKKE